MKTSVDIPDMIMEEAATYSSGSTKKEIIVKALEEYNHRHRVASVTKMFGTFRSISSNDEIEALESERGKR